jgi:hypothetical protein
MEKANEERLKLFKEDDLYEIQAGKNITDYFPKPPDIVITGQVLKYKSLTKTNYRTGYNYEDDKPGKEKDKEKDTDGIEDVDDLNIVNNDNESIIDNNSLLST